MRFPRTWLDSCGVKASVIVPVYNPGPNIDDCIRTTLAQSLDPSAYEVIFVDDGSTDRTPRRLAKLARRTANVRFERIANSGWPGRPRNVGLDLARGEYVYFMDNDDWLGPEALERMIAMADRDRADVLTGKVVGQGKHVARAIFRANRSGVTLAWRPLTSLLTPHKLFRRDFLVEHGIRFPEGHYRLEDHAFVLRAYFAARSISILADYPCYHWVLRDTEVNASTQRFDAADYFGRVREILDIVEEHTEPGELRDRLQLTWYTSKMLARVGGTQFVVRPADYREELYREIRALALERFGERFDPLLSQPMRLRAQLLREDRFDDLLTLARREGALEAKVNHLRVERAANDERVLRILFRARLTGGARGGGPLAFERVDGELRWVAPDGLALTDEQRRAQADLEERVTVQLIVRSLADGAEYLLRPRRVTARLVEVPGTDGHLRARVAVLARLNPARAAAGAALAPGDWDLDVRLVVGGFHATATIPGGQLRVTPDGRAILRPPDPPPGRRERLAARLRRGRR